MKKWKVLCIVLAAVLVLALAASGGTAVYFVRQAQQWHDACLSLREQLRQRLEESCLSVTENGDAVGEFPLASLRADDPYAQIDEMFSETDRLTAEQFAALSWTEQLGWYRQTAGKAPAAWYRTLQEGGTVSLALSDSGWDFSPVFAMLDNTPRIAAQDAYAVFSSEDGAFETVPEQPGNELADGEITKALLAAVSGAAVTADSADTRCFELTSCDCYLQPEVTAGTADFDYAALLARQIEGKTIELRFFDAVEYVRISDYVSCDETGRVVVDSAKRSALCTQLSEKYAQSGAPFFFDSYDRGWVEIGFISCAYVVSEDFYWTLEEQLRRLDDSPIEVPMQCFDEKNHLPFDLGDSYIAVDIESQTVTYYKDGALIVHSDVVTGLPNGHATPTGLYQVLNSAQDCWLSGPDFHVFVKYWVGFIGTLYGLHDASWRDGAFGGEIYLTDGSHGCVNTPDGAMQTIYETVEPGTPVLIF
ncbi:MAG: L,D-transpeptidase [Oscillospiraceae bacterium]